MKPAQQRKLHILLATLLLDIRNDYNKTNDANLMTIIDNINMLSDFQAGRLIEAVAEFMQKACHAKLNERLSAVLVFLGV